MTFITPWLAAAGVLAVSVPILIHLLSRQRRRPVEWAAMRFLIEAFRKQRRRLRLQQILLLATRCLILALLGAALARPLLEGAGLLDGGQRTVYFLIDDGVVSGVDSDGRAALQRHVDQALEVIGSLDASDRVGVVTASRPARALLHPPSTNHGGVIELLGSLRPSEAPTDLPAAFDELAAALNDEDADAARTFVYLLSEFREGSAALNTPLPDSLQELAGRVALLASAPAEHSPVNVQITAIDPVRSLIVPGAADGSGQVTIRLARQGDLGTDVSRVRLSSDGFPDAGGPAAGAPFRATGRTVRWEPGQSEASVDFLLNLTGRSEGQIAPANRIDIVRLSARLDEDALPADNTRHAVLHMRNRIRVVLLQRRAFGLEPSLERFTAGQWITYALQPRQDSAVATTTIEPVALRSADLRGADAVIAPRPDLITDSGWERLRSFVDGGGLLIVTPPAEMQVHQWIEPFTARLDLPWRIGPEVEVAGGPGGPRLPLPLAREQPASELLRLIASDLPDLTRPVTVERYLPVEHKQAEATVLLELSGGVPVALAGSPGGHGAIDGAASRGMVVLFTVAPELSWTSLPTKPLMVPLMQEIVRQGVSSILGGPRYMPGERPTLAEAPGAAEMIGPDGAVLALDRDGRLSDPLSRAGLHELRDAAGMRVTTVAVNIDPSSARTDAQPAAQIETWLGQSAPWQRFDAAEPAAALRSAAGGAALAGILLAIVLALLVLETLLARWFSYSVDRGGEAPPGLPGAGATEGLRPTIGPRLTSAGGHG